MNVGGVRMKSIIKVIRFHFAKRDETLNAALENLKSLRDKIKPRG